MLITDSTDEFYVYKKDKKKLVVTTLYSYKYVLNQFTEFTGPLTIAEITPEVLERYAEWLCVPLSENEDCKRPRTIGNHWTVVKGYVLWLYRTKRIPTNPIPYVELPDEDPADRNIIFGPEVRLIMDIVERIDSPLQRALNRAIIQIMASTGVRAAEGCAIKISDLQMEENHLIVRHGKGNKRRNVPLTDACKAAVREWLAVRAAAFDGADSEYLFIHSAERAAFRPDGLRKRLCDLAKLAGIPDFKRFTCHAWRRFAAVEFYKATRDIRAVQMLLGHASVTTTERYINLSSEHLIEMRESLSLSDAPPIPVTADSDGKTHRTTLGRIRLAPVIETAPPAPEQALPPTLPAAPVIPAAAPPPETAALLSPETQAIIAQVMREAMQTMFREAAQTGLFPPLPGHNPANPVRQDAPEPPAIPERSRRTSVRRRP